MLEKIRRPGKSRSTGRFKKLVSYFVFALICLVFVFFTPLSDRLTGYGGGVVAVVGRKNIRYRELSLLERNLRAQYKSRFDTAGAEEAKKLERQLRQTALARLLNGHLIYEGAKREGFFTGDQELKDTIRSIPVFQDKGQFIYSRYRDYLKSEYLSPARFEEQIRREVTRENWTGLFFKAIRSNKLEEEKHSARNLWTATARFAEMEWDSALLEELSPLVKERQQQKISAVLKREKVKWQTLEAFSPGKWNILQLRDNRKVQKALFDFLPETGLIPQITADKGKLYIVEVVSFKKALQKATAPAAENLFLNFDKPARLFESWLRFQEKTIKVNVNTELVDSPQESS